MKALRVIEIVICIILMLGVVLLSAHQSSVLRLYNIGKKSTPFAGQGTQENPYMINDASDLLILSETVNDGEQYDNCYFYQKNDIDLSGIDWVPIGVFGSGKYFYGIYNGGGHVILNIFCSYKSEIMNYGFFGQLGGTVMNLGIESGQIKGSYVGSIASHSIGDNAQIINCYNKATVIGDQRAGGICDNFSNGKVINCINIGNVSAPINGQIVSYDADMIYNCAGNGNLITDFFNGKIVQLIQSDDVSELDFKKHLNAGLQYLNNELFIPWD